LVMESCFPEILGVSCAAVGVVVPRGIAGDRR
jgi:hypothetical protein